MIPSFTRLSSRVHLHTPIGHATTSGRMKSNDPDLILLCTWMGAASKHIAKYTTGLQHLFPTAQIVLITTDVPDIMWTPFAEQEKDLLPAIDVLTHVAANDGERERRKPRILVHLFSNGGAYRTCQINDLFQHRTGEPIAITAMAFDSCPGSGGYARSVNALSVSLPRGAFYYPSLLLLQIFLIGFYTLSTLGLTGNFILNLRRDLLDTRKFSAMAPRVYLYSKADVMVGPDEVEEHAMRAKQKGWRVETVKFEHSPHAGHIMEDADRYWGAVERLWDLAVEGVGLGKRGDLGRVL